ncbi:MAG TPA: 3-hydroxyacyl-CoA dehydrogenase NAD-binding domain-containing protein, partial [Bacteroidota bacterium]|nr:3-hydroxyacyl-CoA dehydrogenase NAD-binding domain-containing protein [Bacteroidota bacterium]
MAFKISVVGTGYVGIVSGTTFAAHGNSVICVDIDEQKVQKMREGIPPIYEPGLEWLLKNNIEGKILTIWGASFKA